MNSVVSLLFLFHCCSFNIWAKHFGLAAAAAAVSVYSMLFTFSAGEWMCFSFVSWTMVSKKKCSPLSFAMLEQQRCVHTIANRSWIHLMSMNTVYVFSRRIRESKIYVYIRAESTYTTMHARAQITAIAVFFPQHLYRRRCRGVFSLLEKHVSAIIVLLLLVILFAVFLSLSVSILIFVFSIEAKELLNVVCAPLHMHAFAAATQ